jgi:methyltransferase-like protein 6
VEKLLVEAGFAKKSISYVHRRTINKKDGIDVPRIFVQAEFTKTDVRLCFIYEFFAQQSRL